MGLKLVRQDTNRHLRLGSKHKRKQTWRKPDGRHSKMRTRRKSYPRTLEVGYKAPRSEAGKINGLLPLMVHNVDDLAKVGKEHAVLIAKVGARNRALIVKAAEEKKLVILNMPKKKKDKKLTMEHKK